MDIQQLKYYKILVVGDSCEDVYHFGTCDRISPEAPVPIFKETSIKRVKGMSSNVLENVKTFGCKTVHLTNKTTLIKRRFVDSRFNQHILRVDQGESESLEKLDCSLLPDDINAVIISDYNKGFVTSDVCKTICDKYNILNIPIFVDSKKKDPSCFNNCFVNINHKESDSYTSGPINSNIITTLGPLGAECAGKIYPTDDVEVFDVSGAGDVFLVSFSLHYLLNNNIDSAIIFANRCASRSVTKFGTYVITEDDINEMCS